MTLPFHNEPIIYLMRAASMCDMDFIRCALDSLDLELSNALRMTSIMPG